MKSFLKLISFISIFALTSCGGGSSDSGGGEQTIAKLPVQYTGTQQIILSAGGQSAAADPVDFVLVYDPNNFEVKIVDADFTISTTMATAYGKYSLDTPVLTIPIDATITCTGPFNYSGEISPTLTNGNISGTLVCNGVPVEISGTYSAKPNGLGKSKGSSLADVIRASYLNR